MAKVFKSLRTIFARVVWLSILLAVPAARAGGLTILPVRLELSSERGIGAFSITNDSDQPVMLDVRVLRWAQKDGDDQYTETRELLVTPPAVTLAPRATQIVRIGLRRSPEAVRELTYRLFVTEVPSPGSLSKSNVTMSLRLSVPIFVRSVAAASPSVEWKLERKQNGEVALRAINSGAMHYQLADLRLSHAGVVIATHREPAYLLAEQEKSLRLTFEPQATLSGSSMELTGYSDAGPIRVDLATDDFSTK
jgi:fimbrial chaperone protein